MSVRSLLCVVVLLRAVHVFALVSGSVEWYRTAQGTPDLITRQPDLQFTSDFPFSTTLYINRCAVKKGGGARCIVEIYSVFFF